MKKIKIKSQPDFKEEKKLWRRGFRAVAGLDEAGRGPLAGPVVAGAVCFLGSRKQKKFSSAQIKDSKRLSAKQREAWYEFLTQRPEIKWGVGMVSEKIIDRVNILEATKLAMKMALENLKIKTDFLLVDGNSTLPNWPVNQKAVIGGDEKIWSCAAASIIAKVTRDRLMLKYHRQYSAYGFDRHKGYGTTAHIRALKKHGASPIHRLSFRPLKLVGAVDKAGGRNVV